MCTRRSSASQRCAAARAARSPAPFASLSPMMMTARTIGGSTSATKPEVDSAAQAGCAVAVIAASAVSIPSAISSVSAGGRKAHGAAALRGLAMARSRRCHPPSGSRSSQVAMHPDQLAVVSVDARDHRRPVSAVRAPQGGRVAQRSRAERW